MESCPLNNIIITVANDPFGQTHDPDVSSDHSS